MTLSSYPLTYFASDVWTRHGDPFVQELFLMGTPWRFALLYTALIVAIYSFHRQNQRQRNQKPDDIRHYKLVYSGFWFGVNGVGGLCGTVSTAWFTHAFMCLDRNELDMHTISLRYLGWIYLMTLIGDLINLTFETYERRKFPASTIAWQFVWFFVVYIGFTFYPTGHFAYAPLLHCFIRLFVYGAQVMESSSDEIKSQVDIRALRLRNETILALMWLSIFVHQTYFGSIGANCGSRVVTNLVGGYALLASFRQMTRIGLGFA